MNQALREIKQQYFALALICVGFIVISCIIQINQGFEWASLNITKTKGGEYWRLITGHLVHLDWQHWAMNMTGLSLCMAVYRDDMARIHWPLSFVFISLFSSIGMLYLSLDYAIYVGFSDVLHGWILVGASALMHKEPKLALAVYALFWIKIIEENLDLKFFTNASMDINIAKESHILGACGGIIYALIAFSSFRQWLLQPTLKAQKNSV